MLKNHILQHASKQQQAKSHLSFGMCTFSPQRAIGKITHFLRNVHFFASGKCTFSPQQARSKVTRVPRNVRFFAAKFSDFSHLKKAQKTHLATASKQQQQAKSNITFDICTFSQERTLDIITAFIRYVHFFASSKRTLTPQQARSKITPFLRNVRFFAAKFSDECALFCRNAQ